MIKIKIFLKKYWLFILLATIATLLILFYFILRSNPVTKKEKLNSLITPDIKNFSVKNIKTNELEKNYSFFEKEIEVYETDSILINDQQAIEIARNFGYNQEPQINNYLQGPIYDWTDDQFNLTIYLQQGRLQYTSNQKIINNQVPNFQESENKFKDFLNEKKLIFSEKINIEIQEKNFYFSDGNNFIKTSEDDPKKEFIFLRSLYKLNKLKIDGPETPFISIYLGSNFQISRFDFNKIFEEINLIGKYPIKTKEEVLNKIKIEPMISFLKDVDSFYQENLINEEKVPNLKSLSFNKIELIYYKSINKQTSLQPVFLITGEAITEDNKQAEVGLYLPAIKDEYLLK